jgi:clathrin heavy chain
VLAIVVVFMTTNLPHKLIELFEMVVLQNFISNGNHKIENILILVIIKVDKTQVMDYINKLDNFEVQ